MARSAVNGPPGTKRTMKNVAVMITKRTGMVCSRRRTTKRNMGGGAQMTEDRGRRPVGKAAAGRRHLRGLQPHPLVGVVVQEVGIPALDCRTDEVRRGVMKERQAVAGTKEGEHS